MSSTLTISQATKLPIPQGLEENVKALNFSKTRGGKNFNASLSF